MHETPDWSLTIGKSEKNFYKSFFKETVMSNEEKFNTARWDAETVREYERPRRRVSEETRRKRRKQGQRRRLVVWLVFVFVVSAIFAGVGWLLANDMCSFNKDPVTVTVEVTKDDDLNSISKKLKSEGLIEYRWFFKLFGGVRHASDKIGIGKYELTSDMDYNALINGMRNTNASLNADTVKVSIPEGYNVRQIISLLAKYGVNTEESLLQAAETARFDYAFIDNDSRSIARLEGYLFPDTYDFFVGEEPVHALSRLLANFSVKVDDELTAQIEASPYSMKQILTIASLIEKETDGGDRENVASVIYNRLNNVGETYHLLQIDASLIYGLGDRYTGQLTESDLEFDSPYNLSKYEGLPPTPIGNPGLASIRAAVEPASTGYYFYALGTDGVHHFFKTYREHVNFVNSNQYGG